MEKQTVTLPLPLEQQRTTPRQASPWSARARLAAGAFLAVVALRAVASSCCASVSPPLPACATSLAPLGQDVFAHRRARLAATLKDHSLAAYVAEPSANTQYYANFSKEWHLSERPFLLVTLPDNGTADGPSTLVVVPSFEKSRAKLQLPLALDADERKTVWLPWHEYEDPYARIAQYLAPAHDRSTVKLAVDENVRAGIAADLRASLARDLGARSTVEVVASPKEVRSLRERKTEEEIERLTCANELTLWAIRETKKDLYFGISEGEASRLLDKHFKRAGFGKADGLVLFGPDAALPHGASGDRRLGKDELVLIDAGGIFQGYTADITRTFALKGSKIPEEHLRIWSLVHEAQKAAYNSLSLNATGASVDNAARSFLNEAGYGQYFTHRLGHGIGLEGHEAPYLHAGQHTPLQTANTFSNEPGVYIEGQVGVRLEDCWALGADGRARPFTAQQESVWVV